MSVFNQRNFDKIIQKESMIDFGIMNYPIERFYNLLVLVLVNINHQLQKIYSENANFNILYTILNDIQFQNSKYIFNFHQNLCHL